jgi:hypothetical protein
VVEHEGAACGLRHGNSVCGAVEGLTAGAETHDDFAAFAARLKTCPDTKREFFDQLLVDEID